MTEDTPDLAFQRARLRAQIGRHQTGVYNGIGMIGSGVMCACIAFLGIPLATLAGVGAGAILVPLGITRVLNGLRGVSRSHAELESIEPKPLPPARVIE